MSLFLKLAAEPGFMIRPMDAGQMGTLGALGGGAVGGIGGSLAGAGLGAIFGSKGNRRRNALRGALMGLLGGGALGAGVGGLSLSGGAAELNKKYTDLMMSKDLEGQNTFTKHPFKHDLFQKALALGPTEGALTPKQRAALAADSPSERPPWMFGSGGDMSKFPEARRAQFSKALASRIGVKPSEFGKYLKDDTAVDTRINRTMGSLIDGQHERQWADHATARALADAYAGK